ncbi:MAG: hypothetical protein IT385_02575 [Deltaproteobacteria bacterium]|nr:hypothetical protein [Deltaproteobacteria bacterium]
MKSIALLLVLVSAPLARAAEPTPPPAGRGAPRVIELEAMVIEGKISKPQVFYVLGRSRVEYESLKLQRTFVDRIVTSAKKNPF